MEIVSNQEGGEEDDKLRKYEPIGVPYYVIFDPWRLLSERALRIYQFAGANQGYVEQVGGLLDAVGLGLSPGRANTKVRKPCGCAGSTARVD